MARAKKKSVITRERFIGVVLRYDDEEAINELAKALGLQRLKPAEFAKLVLKERKRG